MQVRRGQGYVSQLRNVDYGRAVGPLTAAHVYLLLVGIVPPGMAVCALIRFRDRRAVFLAGALENVFTALLRGGQFAVRQAVAVGTQGHRLDVADQVAELFARVALRAVEVFFGARPAFGFQVRIAAIPLEWLGAVPGFERPGLHDGP